MSLSGNWKLYYQAKFTLYLLKNKIVLNNEEREIIIIEEKDEYVEWQKVEHGDGDEDIDFVRYVGKIGIDN